MDESGEPLTAEVAERAERENQELRIEDRGAIRLTLSSILGFLRDLCDLCG
jgi:hypothetical protein